MSSRFAHRILSLALALGLALAAAGGARAAEDEPAVGVAEAEARSTWSKVGESAFDVLVLRPLGAAATVAGFAFFVASAPLVAPAWEIGTTWDVFVMGPADYTFVRPLGDF